MTATNINIEDFIRVLTVLQNNGHKLIDLDMLPDEQHPSMNKLVIHPVNSQGQLPEGSPKPQPKPEIRNPEISRDNNDIFSSFDL